MHGQWSYPIDETTIKGQRKLNYLRSENFFPLMICTLSVGRHSHRMGTVVKFLLSLKNDFKKEGFSINFYAKSAYFNAFQCTFTIFILTRFVIDWLGQY